jgi:hypothetical protein
VGHHLDALARWRSVSQSGMLRQPKLLPDPDVIFFQAIETFQGPQPDSVPCSNPAERVPFADLVRPALGLCLGRKSPQNDCR